MSSTIVNNRMDVVFSFDTTGSMYPVIGQVRSKVRDLAQRLAKDIPGIRIGIIAHGDYCDEGRTYVTKTLDLTEDVDSISRFVDRVEATGGGDSDECYELVLHEARKLAWKEGHQHILVMIGDAEPHEPGYRYGGFTNRIDWREEAKALQAQGVIVHAVQALAWRGRRESFWHKVANLCKGVHVELDQFQQIGSILSALCIKQGAGDDKLEAFADELITKGLWNRQIAEIMAKLSPDSEHFKAHIPKDEPRSSSYGSTPSYSRPRSTSSAGSRFVPTFSDSKDLERVRGGRFQILDVPHNVPIREFVQSQGILFQLGRGFYEFTKTETIQHHKEVILMDKASGDLFSGAAARRMLGLPDGVSARLKPADLDRYRIFVQSTSVNRKLIGGTGFLYEVPRDDSAVAA